MGRLTAWRRLLTGRSRRADDLDAELRAWLDEREQALVASGLDPQAARRAAKLEMGSIDSVKDAVDDVRTGRFVEQLAREVRFAGRMLRRSPSLALGVVLTLALGVGANTAIFSIVRAMLIAPLPFREPSRLVFVWADLSVAGYPRAPLAGPEVQDLRDRTTLFSGFGAIWSTTAALTGDNDPEQLRIALVTTNFFNVLGADAAIGRTFSADDEQQAQAPPRAILLSWATWQRRFGGNPSVVGSRIQVNGIPSTVVGVMPPGFRLFMPPDASVPDDIQAWQLLNPNVLTRAPRGQHFLRVVGRMKPGVTLEDARRDVARVANEIAREYAEYGSGGRVFNTVGLQADGVRLLKPVLLALFGGVAILLLMACVNVASLLIARAAARDSEIAVRLALGAGARHLVAQCLAEGLLLAAGGVAVGVVIARWLLAMLLALRPATLERLATARLDPGVLAFTAVTSLVWGVLLSLTPLAEMFRVSLTHRLQQGGRRPRGAMAGRLRAGLVVLQIAFSVVLLVSAALVTRSFLAMQRVDPGFRSERLLSFRLSLPGSRYRSAETFNQFGARLEAALAALPGVSGVGAISHIPYDSLPNWGGPYITAPGEDDTVAPLADNRAVTPGLFQTVGAQLVEGRWFTDHDDPQAAPVVIVDDQLARRAWPGQSALGKRIASDPFSTGHAVYWATVVGVVRHLRHRSLVENLGDQVYFPERQIQRNPMAYLVRSTGDPAALATAVRQAVASIDPQLPTYDIRPLREYVAEARATQRFTTVIAASFAGVALALACVGVYGVIAYAARLRRYEFGVRLAFGAEPRQLRGLVLREGVRLAAAGVAIGLATAAIAATLLRQQLYAVGPTDAVSYAFAAASIVIMTIAACWAPAYRAARMSPLDAIRAE